MAYEILERNYDAKEIVLVGLQERGYSVAEVLQAQIQLISKIKTRLIALEIDKENPIDCKLTDSAGLDGKIILIVDDVVNSGRTLMYALNPFLNILAAKIQIAVMVDRSHKDYPIVPDFIGMSISTTLQEHIQLEVKKGQIQAFLV
jgi:pyrimidine operon attenuation protein/uracil phosphoribosyltransferase